MTIDDVSSEMSFKAPFDMSYEPSSQTLSGSNQSPDFMQPFEGDMFTRNRGYSINGGQPSVTNVGGGVASSFASSVNGSEKSIKILLVNQPGGVDGAPAGPKGLKSRPKVAAVAVIDDIFTEEEEEVRRVVVVVVVGMT